MSIWIRTFPRRPAKRRKLSLPAASGSPKIAQISMPDSLFETAVYFSPRRGSGLETYKPEIIIGCASHLEILAHAAQAGQTGLASLNFAVYSITGCRDMPLSPAARHSLWQAFGVPVYELLLDCDQMPIAAECGAHEGWHAESGVTFVQESGQLWFKRRREPLRGTGLKGRLVSDICPCGRSGQRIVEPQLDFGDPLRERLAANF